MTNINDTLKSIKDRNQYKNYIEYIRFPRFKNLSSNLKIDFSFPVTAITGQNGSNKSSILRAIQACPEGNSISDYWFETEIDKIDKGNRSRDPQRFIYGYKLPSGKIAEAVKTRIVRAKDGDKEYWEPGKTRAGDEMPSVEDVDPSDIEYAAGTRWKLLDKDVVYLDFRSELPAFDILMNFNHRKDSHSQNITSKKETIRRYSKNLSQSIEDKKNHALWGRERVLTPAFKVKDAQLKEISKILGREYSEICLIQHDYYDFLGWTAILKSSDLSYSEAFSGSGEFAVIMLVNKVANAKENSLILLDEPETSLHPGAQIELMNFIKEYSKKKKHQFVISTHSTHIIDSLPSDAIKALDINPATGKVILKSQSSSKVEAFSRLGSPVSKETIFVEDNLAKFIIKAAVHHKISDEALRNVEIKSAAAGADTIRQGFLPGWSMMDSSIHVIFDGDQREYNIAENFDDSDESTNSLKRKVEILGVNLKHEGGNDSNTAKIDLINKNFLNWYSQNVKFLPGISNPECQLLYFIDEDFRNSNPYLAVAPSHSCTTNCPGDTGTTNDECPFFTLGQEFEIDSWQALLEKVNSSGKELWVQKTKDSDIPDFDNDPTSQDIFALQKRTIKSLISSRNEEFDNYLQLIADSLQEWIV
ncbi:ATP-dependent nuclease [Rothia nasimurium]|uniref:ATP-dependent nuclease n=1 Tax=Rothia nasimurium TaxID=85336 RepID=UPI001F258840|nr:ATP-binding protein [Rothia nasimurium]